MGNEYNLKPAGDCLVDLNFGRSVRYKHALFAWYWEDTLFIYIRFDERGSLRIKWDKLDAWFTVYCRPDPREPAARSQLVETLRSRQLQQQHTVTNIQRALEEVLF